MTEYLAEIIIVNAYTGRVVISYSCSFLPNYKGNTALIDFKGGINWQR